MLPYKVDDEDEDDYVVEGRDPEGDHMNTYPLNIPSDRPLSMHPLTSHQSIGEADKFQDHLTNFTVIFHPVKPYPTPTLSHVNTTSF